MRKKLFLVLMAALSCVAAFAQNITVITTADGRQFMAETSTLKGQAFYEVKSVETPQPVVVHDTIYVERIVETIVHDTIFIEVAPNSPIVSYSHAVDLGLPSGTKWADMNVGAEKPEDYGWHLAWGETEPKDTYDWSTYKYMAAGYSDGKGCSKYQIADGQTKGVWYNGSTFVGDNKTVLDPEDDAALVNWGGNWRMPTDADMTELFDKCTWTWTSQNGVYGRKVTGPNGNSIFLPAAGTRIDGSLGLAGSDGCYWSSSLYESNSSNAWGVDFDSGSVGRVHGGRYLGRSVRPVCQ